MIFKFTPKAPYLSHLPPNPINKIQEPESTTIKSEIEHVCIIQGIKLVLCVNYSLNNEGKKGTEMFLIIGNILTL